MVREFVVFSWFFVSKATPFVLRLMWEALMWLGVSFAALWRGISPAAVQLADIWIEEAIKAGWPTMQERQLWRVLYIFAYASIIAGWVALSFITVFIVRAIF